MDLNEVIFNYRIKLITHGRGHARELLEEMGVSEDIIKNLEYQFDTGSCSRYGDYQSVAWPAGFMNRMRENDLFSFAMTWDKGLRLEVNFNDTYEKKDDLFDTCVFTCSLSSNLKKDAEDDKEYCAAIDGIEALILSMASHGVDISDVRMRNAIVAATEAIANNA